MGASNVVIVGPCNVLATVFILPLFGGCTLGDTDIRRGTPIVVVQAELGVPDAIADQSSDLKRFYTPDTRPNGEWPWDAPRTFYYLDQDLYIEFVKGKAATAGSMPAAEREMLVPLVSSSGKSE